MARQRTRAKHRSPFEVYDRPVGWAVVGLGMGTAHAGYISRSPGMRLLALCDTDRGRLDRCAAELPGARPCTSLDQILDDERVEGVSLVLPHDQHGPAAIRCLKAGRHVIVDKPLCLSVAEGKKMIAEARRRRRLLSVFLNRRWDADYVTIQRLVDRGTIGRVRYLESRHAGARRFSAGVWRAERRRMGGLLYDWGAHLIDQALLLIKSRPVSVYAFAQSDLPADPGREVEDRAGALIHFEDGAVAMIAWFLNSPAPVPRFIIEGERGGIRAERPVHSARKPGAEAGLELYLTTRAGGVRRKTVPFAKVDWSSYYRNVGRALTGKEELIVRPEQALRHVAVVEAAYKSIAAGRAVPLPRELF